MTKNIEVCFGPLYPSLSEQLAGVISDAASLDHFEKDRLAINRLLLRGLLSDSEADRGRRRLMKSIVNLAKQST